MSKPSIAICAIAKDEDLYIDEWIRYHLKLGIDDIYIFQNNWTYSGSMTEHFGVHFYSQDGEVQQLPAYNRFLGNKQMWIREHDWVAFIDIDEFICMRSKVSLLEVLQMRRECPSLAVNWRMFGSSGLHYDGTEHSVLKRFTKCCKSLNRHVKQIVNLNMIPKSALMLNPHFGNFMSFNQEGHRVIGPYNRENLDKVHDIELNHYCVKTPEECRMKVSRGRADMPAHRDNEDDKFFKEFDLNEVENTAARDFMLS